MPAVLHVLTPDRVNFQFYIVMTVTIIVVIIIAIVITIIAIGQLESLFYNIILITIQ